MPASLVTPKPWRHCAPRVLTVLKVNRRYVSWAVLVQSPEWRKRHESETNPDQAGLCRDEAAFLMDFWQRWTRESRLLRTRSGSTPRSVAALQRRSATRPVVQTNGGVNPTLLLRRGFFGSPEGQGLCLVRDGPGCQSYPTAECRRGFVVVEVYGTEGV